MQNRTRNCLLQIQAVVTTADFAGLSRQAAMKGIPLLDVFPDDSLSYNFSINQRDYKKLLKICNQRGDHLKIIKGARLFSAGKTVAKRPVLLAGVLFLLIFFLYLPSRVLFIRVTGNQTIPNARILEAAYNGGLRILVSRRNLRSEQIKNRLLQQIPELSWAGINTRGCVAEISVRELPEKIIHPEGTQRANMIALRDGVVTKCVVRQGELLCRPGQAVCEGEILISNHIKEGKVVREGTSDGEIFAITHRSFSSVTPSFELKKGEMQQVSHGYTLLLGKKRIKICGSSGNPPGSCGRIYKEYYMTLPGGFQLPVGLGRDTYLGFALMPREKGNDQVYRDLMSWADLCLQRKMAAGMILRRDEYLDSENGIYRLTGKYLCHEMIGRICQEKIGVKQDTWKES